MKRRLLLGLVTAVAATVVVATPASAHGGHDARPLALRVQAGPYVISLWQVYPDTDDTAGPRLIVLFDGRVAAPPEAVVVVGVNSTPAEIGPSLTTSNGWETTGAIVEGDVLTVTIADGTQAWDLESVVVPPPLSWILPMRELIYISAFLSGATLLWVAGRTKRTWRRPAVTPT